jgi:S1-C subfamily serine protease
VIAALVWALAGVASPARADGVAEPAGARGTIADMRDRALRGDAHTQYMLARRYAAGDGVGADPVEAYFWYNIAARGGITAAASKRDAIGVTLSASEFISVQTRVRRWNAAHGLAMPGAAAARGQRPAASATGFVVDTAGHALTSAHAIEGCGALTVQGAESGRAEIQARDSDLDLALLQLDGGGVSPAPLGAAAPVRLGAEVVVFGYPLQGVLAYGANVTDGIVSGLAGPGNDARLFQHTAPVQPGNSGSPLLDRSGAVVGVVVSKLNSWQMARRLGDLPQNINFGLRAQAVRDFLAGHGIASNGARGGVRLSIAEIAERAGRFTLLLECWR